MCYLYFSYAGHTYLRFSDAAKFADIGRNIIENNLYASSFGFFPPRFEGSEETFFYAGNVPFLTPAILAVSFLIFGVNDFAVIFPSMLFFVGLVIAVYLLTKKLYGELAGLLAALAVAGNIHFLDYATSGASEVLFTLEIILMIYLFLSKRRLAFVLGILLLIATYFTRSQAVVFIFGIGFLLIGLKKGLKVAIAVSILGAGLLVLVDNFVLYPLSRKLPIPTLTIRAIQAIRIYAASAVTSDALRGSEIVYLSYKEIFIRTIYNIYNFYRSLPDIVSPYLFALYVFGLTIKEKSKEANAIKITSAFLAAGIIFMAAITIPLYRYLHPIVPLLYVFACGALVKFVRLNFKSKNIVTGVSLLLLLMFCVGQTLGTLVLDSRSLNNNKNIGKPPAYRLEVEILKNTIDPNALVVTNLDTWGTWYGNRSTLWFSLRPEMLEEFDDKIDAIYLTNYKIDDENYYMGLEWRDVFEHPENPQDEYIRNNYEFVGEYKILADQTYENEEGRAVLLIHK